MPRVVLNAPTAISTAPERRARFPFRYKLAIGAGLLAIVPTAVVGALLVSETTREVERSLMALQISVTDDLARTIDGTSSEADRDLAAIASTLGDASLETDVRLGLVTRLLETGSLDQVTVYDAAGLPIDTLEVENVPELHMPEELDRTLRATATERGSAIAPARRMSGEPRYLLIAPVRAGDRVTAFVVSAISFGAVQERVDRLTAQLAPYSGRLFVVDRDRRVLAHSDLELAHSLSPAPSGIVDLVDLEVVGPGFAQTGEYRDGEGLGTVVGLSSRPWAVVVEVPAEEAYAPVDRMRVTIALTAIATAVVALLLALAFARRITAPLAALTSFARDLAARRFDRRVHVETRDELALLGDAMSGAACDLAASEERIRTEEAIRADLGRYLPAELVERVATRRQDMKLGGRRTEVTVLFADVVAFTPLTERLEPEQIVALLNELFSVLTDIVFRHGGMVDKFMGDCVMAVFGAIVEDDARDDHAARALAAAEDMQRWLETANPGWKKRYGTTLDLAIGVNTGDAIVGNVGSSRRMEFTAIGDAVNVAARLEAIARPKQILLSAATKERAGDGFDYTLIGERTLAGRAEPIVLYEVEL
jgi:adenylate cyclase